MSGPRTQTTSSKVAPLSPGCTLGVLGGGQLGRMFVEQARRMGYEVIVLDPDPSSPAGSLATEQICADYDDPQACATLAQRCAAITCEFENVPIAAFEQLLKAGARVAPGPRALAVAQHRHQEKQSATKAGFEVVPYVHLPADAASLPAIDASHFPAILKSARLGYDGKGQCLVQNPSELDAAYQSLGRVECVLEQRIDLKSEISVVVVRDFSGQARSFPCIENMHRNGILDVSLVPARVAPKVQAQATQAAIAIAEHLSYVGVLTVEFFVSQRDKLYVNEMAPRPHNSGHLSINASDCSQFEHQLRTLCALPAAACDFQRPAAMINLLGDLWENPQLSLVACLEVPGTSLHLYGKSEPRPGRKMGHLTVLAPDPQTLADRIKTLRAMLSLPPIEVL